MNARLALSLTLVATSFGASATTMLDERWYVAPALSYVVADTDRDAKNDLGVALAFGKAFHSHWNLEINVVADSLESDAGGPGFHQFGLLLDGLYLFDRSASTPYAVIGIGGLKTTHGGSDESGLALNAGVGYWHSLNDDGLGVRGDIRYRMDDNDAGVANQDSFGDWLINIGMAVPIGTPPKAAPTPAPAPAPVTRAVTPPPAAPVAPTDGDHDGVIDSQDRCPTTPAGRTVNAQGCELDGDGDGVVDSQDRCPTTPAGRTVNAQGCELDGDGDGVVDSQDRCPTTPSGVKVNAQGCELDSDNDGVLDSKDQCPDSKASAKVDTKGCELADVIILKGVNFETNSDRLTSESSAVLDDAAATLTKHSTLRVEVGGYTDNKGSDRYNQKLSERRAKAVMNYLIGKGVPSTNLTAKGYGANNPVADNATEAGRADNRRVELHLLSP